MSRIKRIIAAALMLAMLVSSTPAFADEMVELTPQQIAELTGAAETCDYEAEDEQIAEPTVEVSTEPTAEATVVPFEEPSVDPAAAITAAPTVEPTAEPTLEPTVGFTTEPAVEPSSEPSAELTDEPVVETENDLTGASESTILQSTQEPADYEALSPEELAAESGMSDNELDILPTEEIVELMASFELTKTGSNGSYTLSIGESLRLYPVFADENGWEIKSWKSSASKRAAVDEDGIVEALAEGSVTVTATTTNSKKATVKIKVVDPSKPDSIELNCGNNLSLAVGEEFSIEAEVLPETTDCELSYKSSKTNVATVDEDCLITAVKKGSATITVKTANSKKDTVKIKVV